MAVEIRKAAETGFCFGVRRAIEMLEKALQEHSRIETLGAVVHNEQVMQRLNRIGIQVVHSLDEIQGRVVAISAHGVSPQVEVELKERKLEVIDTTCPYVRRVQKAARKLAENDFWVVVFGESEHPEVKGVLGWAQGKGLATLDAQPFTGSDRSYRRLGLLAQTTQIPEKYNDFAKALIDLTLNKDAEIRILDTICHDIRRRQAVSLELARKVDLMLVVGGSSSANTRRLFELCSAVIETHLISRAEDINPAWLEGKKSIGITSGTSTDEKTLDVIVQQLNVWCL
jgi:4-hydroxy-3-methylbut-2-en-1-yl diphosphate reductase